MVPEGRTHVFHQYTIRVPDGKRDALREYLKENDIGSEIYYPLPIHQQPLYESLGYQDDLPNAQAAAQTVLSLPIHPALSRADLDRMVEGVNSFMASS